MTKPCFILIACLIVSFVSGLSAQNVSVDVIKSFSESERVSCIITLQDQWIAPSYIQNWSKEEKGAFVFKELASFAQESQRSIQEYLSEKKIKHHSYLIFNGLQVEISREELTEIRNSFDIANVGLDVSTRLTRPAVTSVNRLNLEWGIKKIEADKVWDLGYTGREAVVAGQDTGYEYDNQLIKDRYRGFSQGEYDHNYNWHDAIRELNPLHEDENDDPSNNPCGLDIDVPCDDHNHGTHTMGTMVGQDDENGIGVAPDAKWIACRNMDRGWGKPSTYTECFEWFLAPGDLNNENHDPSKSPHVINNSWGCPEVEGCNPMNWQFMELVVNNLVAAGVMVVASAGNDGASGCGSINRPPSMFDQAFVVGSIAFNDTISDFSSIGPVSVDNSFRIKPDIVAPGEDVRSIVRNGGFGTWSGTSMAGPHVAGTVALMLDANPNLAGRVEEISQILRNTAIPRTSDSICGTFDGLAHPNIIYGFGSLNAYEAVKAALKWEDQEQEQEASFQLYPNPTSGSFVLSYKGVFLEPTDFTLYNSVGEKLLSRTILNRISFFELDQLIPGIYYYSIDNDSSKYSGKVIVQ